MANLQKNIEKLRSLIYRADYNAKNILNDGIEVSGKSISLLVFLKEDNESVEFELDYDDLEEILMNNGLGIWDLQPNENAFDFLYQYATKYELDCIYRECIELMVNQILELA